MTYNLTQNELDAAITLVKSCLANMGGERPIDLDNDPYTWVIITDLTDKGWSRHEAAGTFSSLAEKGIIVICEEEYDFMSDNAYRYLDTIWDEYHANQS